MDYNLVFIKNGGEIYKCNGEIIYYSPIIYNQHDLNIDHNKIIKCTSSMNPSRLNILLEPDIKYLIYKNSEIGIIFGYLSNKQTIFFSKNWSNHILQILEDLTLEHSIY